MKPMGETRWQMLMNDPDLKLTEDEIGQGWHFCAEFDGLLRNTNKEPDSECPCACLTPPAS